MRKATDNKFRQARELQHCITELRHSRECDRTEVHPVVSAACFKYHLLSFVFPILFSADLDNA